MFNLVPRIVALWVAALLHPFLTTSSWAESNSPSAVRISSSPLEPYEYWMVKRSSGEPLDVYVARTEDQHKPLIVFIQGSKCFPLFMVHKKDGKPRTKSTLLFYGMEKEILPHAHFALIERRGLKSFGPPPNSEAEASQMARCTAARGGVSKTERVADVVDVVRAFSGKAWVGGVFLIGHSEGAYVASGAAKTLGDGILSGVGLLSGPGPTQFFDFVLQARKRSDNAGVKKVLDEMIWVTAPGAKGDYRGADVERQITYGITSTDIDDLRASKVPLFVAAGDKDEKAPIESTEVFVAEMLRDPQRKLRYLILPGLGHDYTDLTGADHTNDVLKTFIDWTLLKDKPRDVIVGIPSRLDAVR